MKNPFCSPKQFSQERLASKIDSSSRTTVHAIGLIVMFVCSVLYSKAQSTGYINRPAALEAGKNVLDPNGDGYTSATTGGFQGNDVLNSEIQYRSVPSYSIEPFGDLRRGPDHLYSDFVPDARNIGFYTYFDGTNLLFRMRMGSVVPGAKGYSVLIDTDGRFGTMGASADPNYQPATTGTNGNPGFEIEIVLETNFRIAIYNVDGTSIPALIKSYTNWQGMSQVSIAGTFDNGDPDFFFDFYVPFSDLTAAPFNLNSSTQLRMTATTVMSPQAAIGGPKSDIYGLADTAYRSTNNQYETFINAQPGLAVTALTLGANDSMCTAAPVVNSPISSGTVTITGTWSKSALTGAENTATITVFKNGTSIGSVPDINSGDTWTLSDVALVNGDVITAKAQANGESLCLSSDLVLAQGCNTANIPSSSGLAITCSSNRGFQGTFVAGHQVKLYFINPTTLARTIVAGPAANSPTFGYSATNWFYNGTSYNGSQIPSACSGGSPDMNNGVYYITTNVTGQTCESAPVFACVGLAGTTATPTIAQAVLYSSSTQVSGTATAGAQVHLRINGQLMATATATGGNYSFSGLTLSIGDVVEVRAITANSCISNAASLTVTCYTAPPLLNVDNNSQLTAGQPITGTSSEPAGTVIRVYTSTNSLVSTITVQNGGNWSTSPYLAVAGTSYYATAQKTGCGLSTASASFTAAGATTGRCGQINQPVTATNTSISGSLSGSVANTAVNLYLDGVKVGSIVTGTSTWSITAASLTYPLYSNGVLTIGIQESGKQEQYCNSSSVTISCNTGPVMPIVSPTNSTLDASETQTYTISNAVIGAFYGLADSTTGQSLANGIWATSSTVNLTTHPFESGNYTIIVKGTSLSGVSICSSPGTKASVTVNESLPLTMLEFKANWHQGAVSLSWITENEINTHHFDIERSTNGIDFQKIGERPSGNTTVRNTYDFVDSHPGQINYYRLKLVDIDGRYDYTNVVMIRTDRHVALKVQPNPFENTITVSLNASATKTLNIEIIDRSGRLLRLKRVTAQRGYNSIVLDGVKEIKPGLYFLLVKDDAGSMIGAEKLLKTQ